MESRIKDIVDRWFVLEPALFSICCTHTLSANNTMPCIIRTGKRMFEYNSSLGNALSDKQLEEYLRVECIRIFLKHPYERQPENCSRLAIGLASDIVVSQHYAWKLPEIKTAKDFRLQEGECFEWYAKNLTEIHKQHEFFFQPDQNKKKNLPLRDGDDSYEGYCHSGEKCPPDNDEQVPDENRGEEGATKNVDEHNLIEQTIAKTKLWEEDVLACQEVNNIISATNMWGSIPGDVVEQIKATLVVKLDYKRILSLFHTSVLTQKRQLTRMKPNRRTGFLQMGSRYVLNSKILVAVDVSSSIRSETLAGFYSIIARFFKYGIQTIDTVQFDCSLGAVETLKKANRDILVGGRGGTNFQIIFDYLKNHNKYDGLIILTDGCAAKPIIDFVLHAKVLWICTDESVHQRHKTWMDEIGLSCFINI